MMSRGSVYSLGAGARKSLVLLWTAVLLCSLLLQSMVLAAPAPALALDPTVFELDGNVEGDPGVAGDDWNTIYGGGGSAFETVFITDPINGNGDEIFTGGDTKDISDIPNWLWTSTVQPQDKNDISHAYAAAYRRDGDLIVNVGLDRYASNGAGQVGFWFLQGGFGMAAGGTFNGSHAVGDVLVQIDFENGGSNPVARVYKWTGSGIALQSSGGSCSVSIAGTECAIASTSPTNPAWPYDDKGAAGADNDIPAGGFVEAGINLSDLGLDASCFASFLAETRSSPSESSTLSDFAFGSFSLCSKPEISTHVRQGSAGISVINKGESVYDRAVLTGDSGTVTGTVDFYVCRDADAAPDCSTGGSKVGGSVTLQGGQADSAEYTPTLLGTYCFRAEYTPEPGSKYLATSHTNKTTECFVVIPAEIDLIKTADKASVSAGEQIGFTLTIKSKGPGSAFGVKVSDTLPTTAGLSWTLDAGNTTGTWDLSGGVLSFGGANGVTMAQGAEFSAHVTSPTTKATCGIVNNTGNATTTNDGTDSASASVEVLCPDVKVTKLPDNGQISAGDTATFTIKVENLGPGKAFGVTLSDPLPAGPNWTENEADCSIVDGTLNCTVGELAAGAFKTYTVSAVTTKADCRVLDNTATATATNERTADEGNNSDDGQITVRCAAIDIAKTADKDVVNAGDQIGFTITVTNTGTGNAYNVTASDTLDADFTWTLEPSAGWSLNGNVLSYAAATLAPGASSSVHVTAPTTAAGCGVVPNTAIASAANDGSDEASAEVQVLCPDVKVEKTAVASPVNAGDPIAFDIVVTNLGPGVAYGVTLTDTLPAGISWSENSDQCSITGGVLSCTFGDLAKDATASVRVSGTTSNAVCTTVLNTATVGATNEPQGALGNNADDASVVVNCPDVKVVKDAVTTPISAGDAAGFTITVTNLGPGTAYGVTLNDPLPAGIAWTDNSTACQVAGGILTCDFGSLAQGATASVTLTGTSTAAVCGTLLNTATVAATNELPGATGNNSDDASIVVQCPDIRVTKTAANSPISAGETASFTILVENIGAGKAYDVDLADTLPAGLTWTDGSDACEIEAGVLTCDFGTILPGASRTVTVSAETTAASCGTLPNLASSTASNEPGNVLANNADDASILVDCPQIVITKSTVTPVVSAGDPISFDVVVTNTGAGSAFGVTVNDPLPVVPGVTWSIDAGNTTGTWAIAAGVLKFGPATLAAGGEVKVRIVSGTSSASCATIPNVASLTYTGGSGSDDSSLVVECPDVTISKTAAKSPINAGDTASFTISVWNQGPGTAYGVVVSDTLPAGVAWSSDNDACSIVSGVLTCNVGTLPDDGTIFMVTVSGVTDAADCGPLYNLARVDATNEPAASQGNNQDDATVLVDCARIDVFKSADNASVNAGDQIGFTITVTNTGAGTAYAVTASDSLNPDFTWTMDPSAGWTLSGTTLSYSAATLAAGASSSVHVTAPTTADACGTVTNTATASAGNDGSDEASAEVDILCPDVVIEKTAANSPINAGDTASFTISVRNEGPGTAYDVAISDMLPAGVTWTENSEDCSIADGKLTCLVGTLAAGADPFTVTVSGPTDKADCGEIPNLAKVTASNEPVENQGNNEDDATIVVLCAAIDIAKTADAATVNAGDTIGFTITVSNAGPGTAYSVAATDTLDAAFTWTLVPSAGWSLTGNVLTFTAASFPAGASSAAHVTAVTTAETCRVVNNSASVTTGNDGSDEASASTTIQCPDVAIEKTAATSPVLAGQVASFTISVWNEGPGTAYGVVISDTLPAGLAWTEDSEVCSITDGKLTCQVGTLAAADEPFSVTVSAPTTVEACGELPNSATVAASNEPAGATENNEDDATIVVQCASISLVKTAGTAADGTEFVLAKPGNVIFTYVVANTGTADLKDVILVDDNATPANTADDITVTCPSTTLAAGATMTCTATLPVTFGLRTNIAVVTAVPVLEPQGEVTDTDDAVVRVPQPEVTPRPTPKLTPPPTSSLETPQEPTSTGPGLLLVLLALAGTMLAVGYLIPAPARSRRRNDRG